MCVFVCAGVHEETNKQASKYARTWRNHIEDVCKVRAVCVKGCVHIRHVKVVLDPTVVFKFGLQRLEAGFKNQGNTRIASARWFMSCRRKAGGVGACRLVSKSVFGVCVELLVKPSQEKQSKAKQSQAKAKQSKAKQSKTTAKQSKAKQKPLTFEGHS